MEKSSFFSKFKYSSSNPKFISKDMLKRDNRLREAKANADRSNRELRRDRMFLERREKALMNDLKKYAAKGDIPAARLISNQIANYRGIAYRNLENSIAIETRAQAMYSNNKVNRAEVEALKGCRYANKNNTIDSIAKKENKYYTRAEAYNLMEDTINDGMDEIYSSSYSDKDNETQDFYKFETNSIIRQALDPQHRREYYDPEMNNTAKMQGKYIIHFQRFSGNNDEYIDSYSNPFNKNPGVSIYIDTLDLSIDMLKRILTNDSYAINQLGLNSNSNSTYNALLKSSSPFVLGRCVGKQFEPFEFSESLNNLNIKSGSVLLVKNL